MTVAQTILAQLGGNKFLAMTGARNLVSSPDLLQFDLPRNASKVTKVQIKLANTDLYTMAFYRWDARNCELHTVTPPIHGLYADGLRGAFERTTGLDTSL